MSDLLPPVLVVDDDPAIVRLLQRMLRPQFEVFTADRAGEASRLLSLGRVYVVLSDLDLPDGDGLEVLRVAQRLQPSARRILHTGASRLSLTDQVHAGLIHRLLRKPATIEQVRAAMEAEALQAGCSTRFASRL